MKKKARTRREKGVFWLARDAENLGDEGVDVHFHAKLPKVEAEGNNCPHCAKSLGLSFLAGEGSFCHDDFTRVTGIDIKPGTIVKVRLQVVE